MARRLLLLGATGSIGTQALDVVGRSDDLEVVGLSAGRAWEPLVAQARELGVRRIALADADAAARAAEAWTDGEVLAGPEGLVRLVIESEADLVLNALVGSAGLGPTIAALGEGIDLALANKESLVVGGELVTQLAEATGARLLPIDSEHTALHHLLRAVPPGALERMTITASGGPFRGRRREELAGVTVDEALAHPTWAMGGKITIDSATLMNKGLEVMEAHHLFGVALRPHRRHRPPAVDRPRHRRRPPTGRSSPTSGMPDMRIAIAYALHHPDVAELPTARLSLPEVGRLDFEPVDLEAFPCLRLAREAAVEGGTAPCVLNAANEVAVHAFLGGRLDFLGIPAVVEATLERLPAEPVRGFESLYDSDRAARDVAAELVAVRA